MNLSVWRRTAAILTVTAIVFTMSACYQPPGGVIVNPDDTPSGETQPTKEEPIPTLPAEEGQLTLSLLLGIMKAKMTWSQLASYNHSKVDDTHATFIVADNYGKECTLNVTYDTATDAISEAVLSYKDVSVDVLTDNTLVIRSIMLAMNED